MRTPTGTHRQPSTVEADNDRPVNVHEIYPGATGHRPLRQPSRLRPHLLQVTVTEHRRWPTGSELGMATAEYAIATLAAVGFAGLLVVILKSDEVRGFLLGIIRSALSLQ
ncbi:MAG TPA: DUF4244 domain-containing protein [Micrococcaceae bacterium]|nr:DUF4244 domain-containing protein [Micrococcaceae bacterium]